MKQIAILAVVALLPAGLSKAQPPGTSNSHPARQAVEKVLPLLQQSARTWSSKAGCFSCHHQGLGATVVAMARERGYTIDDTMLADQVSVIRRQTPRPEQSVIFGITEADGLAASYLLVALAANGTAPNLATGASVSRMLARQYVSGYWTNAGPKRLPLQGSPFSDTALTLRAVSLYAPASRKAEAALHVQRACQWLSTAAPGDTEDAAMQLLGMAWCKSDVRDIRRARAHLLGFQRPDGGWAQTEYRESDGYATGQALVALNQAGRLSPNAPAFRKGVAFLLRTQKTDGTWLVETRRTWRQGLTYFESGFPHGKHQFLSYAATAWATMALILSSRDQISSLLMGELRPESGTISPTVASAPEGDAKKQELTPLMRAALTGTREDVQRLLQAGADVNEQATPVGITALMCAVHDPERVRLLLAAGAKVNVAARTGHTALLLAADYDGAGESVRLLLDNGAEINTRAGRDARGNPLGRAALRGDRDAISLLMRRGAVMNDLPDGSATMVAAAHEGDAALIAFLLDQGANIETKSSLGRESAEMTPLMFAADSGAFFAVSLLLARGANVNARDGGGMTPLFYAVGALDRRTPMIEALIRAGADLQARSGAGETPLDFANRFGNTQAAEVLQKALAAAQTKR